MYHQLKILGHLQKGKFKKLDIWTNIQLTNNKKNAIKTMRLFICQINNKFNK